jgi:hypothetical protein
MKRLRTRLRVSFALLGLLIFGCAAKETKAPSWSPERISALLSACLEAGVDDATCRCFSGAISASQPNPDAVVREDAESAARLCLPPPFPLPSLNLPPNWEI